ncbi:putative quinol monooxygenase [Cohnella hashimotonis]|uniref:Antibiotic biosynthesis monooxygenase n=1 Tax=Cohnella hashimotonis TaxID=2826895 RepID=A0ABT6TGJ5_9BACL|nr:antibiotic biosynthesis monooxygenase family protein [Cohnella hashimotonis]MDI4645964.1 antibiotic biosynthesis monooxygenase [Cohnella hashimotonis]
MNKFAMFGKLTALPGKRGELADMMLASGDTLSGMDGCIYYIVHEAEEEPDVLWITELWESREAHAASLQNEQVRELIGRCMPLIAEAGGIKVKPIGGKGL